MTWTLNRCLHLLATAFFVGGQIMLAVAVVPAVRSDGRGHAGARCVGWWFDAPRYAPFFRARVDNLIQD